jgi:glyoxylase-like metal-dependent hydrolase (beta-lactamase superfamily II)
MKRDLFKLAIAVLAMSAITAAFAYAQQNGENAELHILPVQGNIYMLVGAGGNITLSIGKDGILLVDTGLPQMSDKVLGAIRKISDKPIRYIINTHVHADHIGGNEQIAKAGSTIAGGNVVGDIGASAQQGATVIAHEGVLDRMSAPTGSQPPMPSAAWPTVPTMARKRNYSSTARQSRCSTSRPRTPTATPSSFSAVPMW